MCNVKTVLYKCTEKHYDNVPKESFEEVRDIEIVRLCHTSTRLLQVRSTLGPFNSLGVETWVE